MDEKRIEKKQEVEVDFKRVLNALWNRALIIALAAVLTAVVTLLGTFFFITPKYDSSAVFYVNNNSIAIGDTSLNISTGDISASKSLVESYIVILMTRSSLNAIIDYAGVDRTYEELEDMITASSVNSTEIFRVTVTSSDPVEAEKIANAIAYILPKRISTIIEGTSAKVVDPAVVPSKASSPSYTNNTIIGFLLGLVLSVSVVILLEIFDVTIREETDITDSVQYPILSSVPDMTAHSKGGYYRYAYAGKPKENTGKQAVMVGSGISFAASEAYKLLRTKLQFSFADGKKCHIIGVSSAMAGEGKSISSSNVAYSLSELGKKVLLVDCDLRRPSLATKLSIARFPGLSNYLSGLCSLEEVIQEYSLSDSNKGFHVISAGGNAPNPIELLSSERMSALLDELREEYDYVILDFPPVGEVSDALAVVEKTDGILMVVRQNYCNRPIMTSAMRQFEFVGARVLGIIYNSVHEHSGPYSYSKRYYHKYGRGYYGAYAASSRDKQKAGVRESSDCQ